MTTPTQPADEMAASPDQVNRANQAVLANLNADGSPKYDSAQGYACALSAIIASDEMAAMPSEEAEKMRARVVRQVAHCFTAMPDRLADCDVTINGNNLGRLKDLADDIADAAMRALANQGKD